MSSESKFPWESVWIGSRYSTNENRLRKAEMKLDAFKRMGTLGNSFGNVLEIGCGNCTFVKIAKESGVLFDSYIGIDRSASAIARAENNIAQINNSKLLNGDACNLPIPDESVDTIIALGVLEHIPNFKPCLTELARVSAPGARLLISTSNTRSLMYLMRLLRQAVGAWRYGFQRNSSFESLEAELRPLFEISKITSLHGDRDFFFSTLLDKAIGTINPRWGRYILAEAEFRKTEDL